MRIPQIAREYHWPRWDEGYLERSDGAPHFVSNPYSNPNSSASSHRDAGDLGRKYRAQHRATRKA